MTKPVTTIFGPPGTGKTTELMRIAEQETKDTRRLLFLSYSRAAAEEAASRIHPDKKGGHIHTSTIHALAFAQLGLNRGSIVDRRKTQDFAATSGIPFKKWGEDEEDQIGDEFMSVKSYAANRLIDPEAAYDHFGRPGNHALFTMFIKSYREWKETYGYCDFDDMLELSCKTQFQGAPVVILDEAQDCSPLQWKVFNQVVRAAHRIYIAGDDDQAIFEWNGADPHGMIKFSEEREARVRVLKQSWRVPKRPHELATAKVGEIADRVPKVFMPADRTGSTEYFGDLIQVDLDQYRGRDTMILVRDAWRRKEAQRQLHGQRVPYRLANGQSPYENKYAKTIRGWNTQSSPQGEIIDSTLMRPNASKGMRWQDALIIPPNLIDFYEGIDLEAPLTVTLSTVHAAKGAEAEHVIVDLTMPARVEAGLDRDRDAEIRVLYVSLTRCKRELVLCGSNPLI